jgi:hypothetical protein
MGTPLSGAGLSCDNSQQTHNINRCGSVSTGLLSTSSKRWFSRACWAWAPASLGGVVRLSRRVSSMITNGVYLKRASTGAAWHDFGDIWRRRHYEGTFLHRSEYKHGLATEQLEHGDFAIITMV